jgi:hypothetical protein
MINDWYEKDGSSIGSDLYGVVDSIKEKTSGIFGFESDKEKIQKADQAAVVDLVKRKLENGQKISPELAAKARVSGIKIPDDRVIKAEVTKPSIDVSNNQSSNLATSTASSSPIEKSNSGVIEKAENTSRVEQLSNLQQNTEIQKTKELEKEKMMIQKQNQSAPTIVSSPTTITNQTAKITTRV